jgi:ABC-type hemin transport system substrate-binding protein
MPQLSSDEAKGQRRKVVFIVSIVEQVFSLGIEERLVAMHTGSVDPKDRFGHEGGDQVMLGSNRFYSVL